MHQFLITLAGLCCVVLACNPTEEIQLSSDIIYPQAGEGIALYESINSRSQIVEVSRQILPYVPIPDEFIAHQVFEYNIDNDIENEQIVAFKDRDGQDDAIGIILIDFDPLRDAYNLSWQGTTLATNLKSLKIYTDDLTGDQRLELIVLGHNNAGMSTADIFHQNSDFDFGLQFEEILNITADIAIEINTFDRGTIGSESDQDISFTVEALNSNPESDNSLDMIQSIYSWEEGVGRYLLQSSANISGLAVEQDQLAALYAGTLSDFYIFIEGIWKKQDDEQIILFSQKDESVQLATVDRQLHFHWINSVRRGSGNSFLAYIQNELISNITQNMQLTILNLNSILVQFSSETNNIFWSGTYTRVANTDNSLQETDLRTLEDITLYPNEISGLYKSDNDWELFFNAPQIILRSSGEEQHGAYVMYNLNGQDILEIVYINDMREIIDSKNYIFSYEEIDNSEEIQRRLYLEEVILTSYGAEPLNTNLIQLEQVIEDL